MNVRLKARSAVTPGAAAQTAPSPPGGVPAQAARDVLLGISRAVQQATIYPQGHPSVAVATAPVIAALARALDSVASLLLVFTSEGVCVGSCPDDVQPYDAQWLGRRLAARGVASLEFERGLPAESAVHLIAWLAQGEELTPGAAAPSFDGCVVAGIDYSRAQFREAPMHEEHGAPAVLAWRAVSRSLADDWSSPDSEIPCAPDELARHIHGILERQEGAGVGELTNRLVGLNSQLAGLSDEVRASVKGRLAQFLGALAPELRERLLTATPKDDAEKLDLLAQFVDRLPRSLVVEVVRNLRFTRGGSTHQFVVLMLKLTDIAAGDSTVSEALADRYRLAGLPLSPVALSEPQAQQALEQLLARRADDVADINSDEYQAQLELLSTGERRERPGFVSERHGDPRDARCVARQSARIALHLLRSGADDHHDSEACVDRVQQELRPCLADRRFDLLAEAAEGLQFVADAGGRDTASANLARSSLEFFVSAPVVSDVVAAVESAPDPVGGPLLVLARAGGMDVAAALVTRLSQRPAREVSRRLGAVLGALNPQVVQSAVADLCRLTPSASHALVLALLALGGGVALAELGREFLDAADAGVRADGCRLVFSTPGVVSVETVLARALQDDDARVVDAGIDAVERHDTLLGRSALRSFLDAKRPVSVAPLQHRLVRVLARRKEPAARLILIDALGRRRSRFNRVGRHLSRSIALALERTGGPEGSAAVTTWRRSAAGLVSRLLGDVVGGAA